MARIDRFTTVADAVETSNNAIRTLSHDDVGGFKTIVLKPQTIVWNFLATRETWKRPF